MTEVDRNEREREQDPDVRSRIPEGYRPLASDVEMERPIAVETKKLSLWYGSFQALFDVDLRVQQGLVTALIGPSGCGKSTLLRSINRINERLSYVRTDGVVEVLGKNVYDADVELTQLRRRVGMVFQRPNPLPISIRENVLFAFNLHNVGDTGATATAREEIVEGVLKQVLLWDSVADRLASKATELSLEEQQKLCIARLLPLKPSVLLMDEPCSALDPEGTEAIEELIWQLRGEYTILMVTHNMAQARRASDETAFMLSGKLVEHTRTDRMFVTPEHQETADYIEGRFG